MTGRSRLATRVVLTLGLCAIAAGLFSEIAAAQGAQAAAPATSIPSGLTEARRLFEAMDYDEVVRALDIVIRVLEDTPGKPAREHLASAYELRARTHLNLGQSEAAAADFRALLELVPSRTLPANLSPKVQSLFHEVRQAMVGQVTLDVTPRDAAIAIDGEPLAPGTVSAYLASGEHRVTASRSAHRPAEQTIAVLPGVDQTVKLALERTSAAATLVTIPPGVEILLGDTPVGTTESATSPPPEAWLARYDVSPSEFSKPFVLSDLAVGSHKVRLRRDCYRPQTVELAIDRLDDFAYLPIRLEPSQGTVHVAVQGQDVQVLLDGVPQGPAPLTLGKVCEGQHLIDVRAPRARLVRRVNVRAGDELKVEGKVRPALAVVSASAALTRRRGTADPRLELERLFERAETVTLFAAPEDVLAEFLQGERLDAEWLAFDGLRKPLSQSSTEMDDAGRVELSWNLARRLDAQGIVALAPAPGGGPNDLLMTVLAAGSGMPDVISFRLGDPQSTAAVIARLDRVISSFQSSLGFFAIDVLDRPGAVVASVEAGGAAAMANLKVGDMVTAVEGRSIGSVADLDSTVQGLTRGRPVALDVLDRAGVRKQISIAAQLKPRMVVSTDRTQQFNKNVVDLRYLLPSARPEERPYLRLNLAISLIGVRAWEEAHRELEALTSAGPAIQAGTVDYLLGLCFEGLHRFAEAERAWRAAVGSPAQLSDDGPSIGGLAEAKLKAMQGRR